MRVKKPQWKIDDEKNVRQIVKTQAFKAVLSYLERLTHEQSFQTKVIKIRKLAKLPVDGLKKYTYKSQNLDSSNKKVLCYPESFQTKKIFNITNTFTKSLGLDIDFRGYIEQYIVYNNFSLLSYGESPICVEDLNAIWNGPFQYGGEKEGMRSYIDHISNTHQVMISIDPYTSERDIVDFIKKTYKTSIKPIQDNYKNPNVKRGKLRSKSWKVLARESFIFENRKDHPLSELRSEIHKRYKVYLNDSQIASAYKREEARRKLSVHI